MIYIITDKIMLLLKKLRWKITFFFCKHVQEKTWLQRRKLCTYYGEKENLCRFDFCPKTNRAEKRCERSGKK